MRELEKDDLEELNQHAKIDLSGNLLKKIPGIQSDILTALDLSNNRLGCVSESLFALRNLFTLKLRGNEIEKLPAGMFEHLPRLNELDLGENEMEASGMSVFTGVSSLVTLHLDSNGFGDAMLVFKDIPSLSVIDLRKNRLTHFPEFSNVKGLTEIYLRSNSISHIPGHLPELSNVLILDLGDNEVSFC